MNFEITFPFTENLHVDWSDLSRNGNIQENFNLKMDWIGRKYFPINTITMIFQSFIFLYCRIIIIIILSLDIVRFVERIGIKGEDRYETKN